jgi:copper(I)-binding protein
MARVDTMPDGTVAVAHPAAIVAFTRDNTLRVLYPFGVRQADWAHDLPRLVRDTGLAAAVDGNVEVTQSVIVAPAGDGAAVVYATVRNRGGAADSLLGCASPAAATCTLHEQVKSGGAVTMRSVPSVTLLAGGEVRLVPGGLHAMLERPRRLLPGDTAPVTWRFARYGDVTAPAAVVSYGDLERVLGSGDR